MFLQHVLSSGLTYCTILIGLVAIIGDFLVSNSNTHISKAIFDNSTHSVIGGLTWFIVVLKIKNQNAHKRLFEVFLCSLIASLIDLDHFFMAKSIRLKVTAEPTKECSL